MLIGFHRGRRFGKTARISFRENVIVVKPLGEKEFIYSGSFTLTRRKWEPFVNHWLQLNAMNHVYLTGSKRSVTRVVDKIVETGLEVKRE